MKNLNLISSLLALTIGIGIAGCNYNDLKQPQGIAGKTGDGNSAVVDFATVKAGVFEPACIKCHGPTLAKADLRLDDYAAALANLDLIRQEVESGDMPPPPPRGVVLSPEQRAMLFAWIDGGGKETAAAPTPSTPIEPVPVDPQVPAATPDFATVSQAVFVPHCIKCHSSQTSKGDLNLQDYSDAAQHAIEIGHALDIDDMPRRAPPLDPALKKIVYAWIDGGAPETVATPVPAGGDL